MRFHCGEGMTRISYYVPLAQAVESMGYTGFTISDSLIYPKASDTKYSYTDDGGREFLENKEFIESFILATAILTATTRLEVTTNVVKLPVRPPLYSAKLAASVAALSGNRFNFGVGLSVWPEDYAAMGVDYANRGKRFDECIEIVRGLCAGGYFEFHGEFYDLPPVKINPVPSSPLPIIIGGHSDAAFRRAARYDGFTFAAGPDYDEIKALTSKLERYRQEAGTADKPFRVFVAGITDPTIDDVRRLEDCGITDMFLLFRDIYAVEEDQQPLQEKIDLYARFADDVMTKV